jgi:hypothetical protein
MLVGLVAQGVLSKDAGLALIDDARNYLSSEGAVVQSDIDKIAAKATAQLEMLSAQIRRERGD